MIQRLDSLVKEFLYKPTITPEEYKDWKNKLNVTEKEQEIAPNYRLQFLNYPESLYIGEYHRDWWIALSLPDSLTVESTLTFSSSFSKSKFNSLTFVENISLFAAITASVTESPGSWERKFIETHKQADYTTNLFPIFPLYFAALSLAIKTNLKPKELRKILIKEINFFPQSLIICPLTGYTVHRKITTKTLVDLKEIKILYEPFYNILTNKTFKEQYTYIPKIILNKEKELSLNIGYTKLNQSDFIDLVIDSIPPTQIRVPNTYLPDHNAKNKCPSCQSINYFAETGENGVCPWCVTLKYKNLKIMSYEENPLAYLKIQIHQKPHVFKYFNNPFLLGCELEYNCSSSLSYATRIKLMALLNEFVIFKEDSSLLSGGFEIVTAPADKETHFEKFTPVFRNFPNTLKISSKTGMHIHLDRKILSPLIIGRMLDFLNRKENIEFISLVGERKLNSYCINNSLVTWKHALDSNNDLGRHVVLNLQKKPTIEFRFFLAPSTFLSFAKNIEFVDILYKFFLPGWTYLTPKESRHYSKLVEFIKTKNRSKKEERNESPHLYEFLKEKGVFS